MSRFEVMRRIVEQEPLSPRTIDRTIDRELETLILKALSKEPARRYSTAGEFAADIDNYLHGNPLNARAPTFGYLLKKKITKHRVGITVAIVLISTGLASAWALYRGRESHQIEVIRQRIDAIVNSGTWDQATLSQIDEQLSELSVLDNRQAVVRRTQANQAFAKAIDETIRRPSLTAGDLAHINKQIQLLAARDPALVNPLRIAMETRQRTWQTLFDIRSPFTEVERYFEPNALHLEEGQLVFMHRIPDLITYGYLVPKIPCPSDAQLEVVVAGPWEDLDMPQLELGWDARKSTDGAAASGYRFSIRAAQPTPKSSVAAVIGQLRTTDGQLIAQIFRDGKVLRDWHFRASDIRSGPLRLTARREGNRLTFQINDLPPMIVLDLFGTTIPSGNPRSFRVLLSNGSAIERVRASELTRPSAPSLLEAADQHYADGQFSEALAAYEDQAVRLAASGAVAQEAHFKRGLCLLALKREDEAALAFEQVFTQPGEVWPAAAGCQLWLIRSAQQERNAEANVILQSLLARHSPERIAELIPDEVRQKMVLQLAYRAQGGSTFQTPSASDVETLKRVIAVHEALDPNADDELRLYLIRSYEFAGNLDAAVEVATNALHNPRTGRNYWSILLVCQDYGRLMRVKGTPELGMAQVQRFLCREDGTYEPERLGLLVERARVHAGMGRLDLAEKDAAEYLNITRFSTETFSNSVSAALVAGYLARERGDETAAKEFWRRATYGRYLRGSPDRSDANNLFGTSLHLLIDVLILGALADDLPDEQVEAIMGAVLKTLSSSKGPTAILSSGVMGFPPSALRDMWKSPRGQQLARAHAFRQMSVSENYRRTIALLAYEL
jgi:tetratricopeptide (TPR) repeat protein